MQKTPPQTNSRLVGAATLAYFALAATASIYLYSSWAPGVTSVFAAALAGLGFAYGLFSLMVLPISLSSYGYTARGFKPSTSALIRNAGLLMPLPLIMLGALQYSSSNNFDGGHCAWERLHITGDLVRLVAGRDASNKWWTDRTEEMISRGQWSDALHGSAHIHGAGVEAAVEQERVMRGALAAGEYAIAALACNELMDEDAPNNKAFLGLNASPVSTEIRFQSYEQPQQHSCKQHDCDEGDCNNHNDEEHQCNHKHDAIHDRFADLLELKHK